MIETLPFARLFEIIVGVFFKMYEHLSNILPYITTPIKDWFGNIVDTSNPISSNIAKAFELLFKLIPISQFSLLDLIVGAGLVFVIVYTFVIWLLNLIT